MGTSTQRGTHAGIKSYIPMTLLTQKDLQRWSGYEQKSKLEKWLKDNRITYTYGKGNTLITTQKAVDSALFGRSSNDNWNGEF